MDREKSHYDLKDKTPSYMEATYPYKAVGEFLDIERLDDFTYIDTEKTIYELKCPNCDLVLRVRGRMLKKYYDRILEVGCPECKLQFNEQTYKFKNGEKEKPLPLNNGQYKGFLPRKVIKVPENIFSEYAVKMFNKNLDNLTLEEGNEIADKYYLELIENER